MHFTNETGISLPLAVWLAHDEYDYVSIPNYISATTLLKPVKQTVLARRIEAGKKTADVADFIASKFGHAVHDSIEKAWTHNAPKILKAMGYPDKIADIVIVNPTANDFAKIPNLIPVYVEQRTIKEFDGYNIGGKFDMIIEGNLFDFKSTSVWSYIKGSKDEDYCLQGSIYRWLNPELVTGDHINIQFIFTDWSKAEARRNKETYPQQKVLNHPVKLMSMEDTERWIFAKLRQLTKAWNAPEEQIPDCTDKELWRPDPQFKYYSDPTKTDGRATRNFPTMNEAAAYKAEKGKGVVITVLGEPKACGYCKAFDVCKQKDRYFND